MDQFSTIEPPIASDLPDMSMWGISQEVAGLYGTLLTLFNGKIHEAMTCVTDQLTQRGYLSEIDNKLLTDLKGQTLKFFNENFPSDLSTLPIASSDLQGIASKEFSLTERGARLVSAKELQGSPYDWVLISSSAYRDRDQETISLKAHEQDIARMERRGNYGTLDWWHLHPIVFQYLEQKEAVAQLPPLIQQHGLILGDCTFSAMYRKLRIEAGTYRTPAIKEMMQAHADQDSGSLLFLHPRGEPDHEGVFNTIYTISRAIMPIEQVSNLASLLAASSELGVN